MLRRMTYSEWAEELHQARGKPDWENLMGKSPGGVAADLGVSRQRVWQLAKEGKLDMILLADDAKAKVTAWLITVGSYRLELQRRQSGKWVSA